MMFRPPRPRWGLAWYLALVSALVLAYACPAHARSSGIAVSNCDSCHGGGNTAPAELSMTAVPAMFKPGDSVTLTLTIRAPGVKVGGAFITTDGVGSLSPLSGEGLIVNGQGLSHNAAKAAVNGAVTFSFGWRAPSQPGGVDFAVAAIAANGNRASSGDAPGLGEFQWVFGCESRTFYADSDRDGYGSKDRGTRLGCSDAPAPPGFAAMVGDCDENDEKVHPGATEVCNHKDDDCNGQVDENAPPVMMWPDTDGDGYYQAQTGTPQLGCGNVSGYAPTGGDCDGSDPKIHPGATEVCNDRDDDCDGEVDEQVRPLCGVGWCARYSSSCNPADCQPGPPAKETCNHFDDDCDGEDDNGACPAGQTCAVTTCVPIAGGTSEGPSGPGGPTAGAAGTAGSVGSAGTSGSSSTPAQATAPAPAAGSCSIRGVGMVGAVGAGWLTALSAMGLRFRRRQSRRSHR